MSVWETFLKTIVCISRSTAITLFTFNCLQLNASENLFWESVPDIFTLAERVYEICFWINKQFVLIGGHEVTDLWKLLGGPEKGENENELNFHRGNSC